MNNHRKILEHFDKRKAISLEGFKSQWNRAKLCQAFYAGDLTGLGGSIEQNAKNMTMFNLVKPFINAVRGFIRQNKKVSRYVAKNQDKKEQVFFSSYANSLAEYLREGASGDIVDSQGDVDMLVCGYGAIETALSYTMGQATGTPNGSIVMGRIDPLSVMWDPSARAPNVIDARWIMYSKDYALEEARELFDVKEDDDGKFEGTGDAETLADEAYDTVDSLDRDAYRDRLYGRYERADRSRVETDKVRVYFYQWYEIEEHYRAENPILADEDELMREINAQIINEIRASISPDDEDLNDLDIEKDILSFDAKRKGQLEAAFGEAFRAYSYKRKVYYTAIVSGKHVFTTYRNLSQSGFTVKVKTGDYDDKNKIWIGLVDSMRDPILYFNKALTGFMYILGTMAKGGVLAEESAIKNLSNFQHSWAMPGTVSVVADGALAGGKVQEKKPAGAPDGYENIVAISRDSIMGVTGIDKSFLGSSENKQETGVLNKQRIRQVSSMLACYFDSVSQYQKQHASLLLDYMKIYAENNNGAFFKVRDGDGKVAFEEIARRNLDQSFEIDIVEGVSSQEEKLEMAETMSSMATALLAIDPAAGKRLMVAAIDYMPIDEEVKDKAKVAVSGEGEKVDAATVQELQKRIEELTAESERVTLANIQADTELKAAKVQEVMGSTMAKLAASEKTKAEAEKSIAEAALISGEVTKTRDIRVVI